MQGYDILMLGVLNLFWPPQDAGIWHVAGWTLVLSVGYSFAILPYTSWGAELDTSYDGRARVAGWREGFTLVGTLVAIAVPFTIGWGPEVESFHGFALLAVIIVCALPVLAALTLKQTLNHSLCCLHRRRGRNGLRIERVNVLARGQYIWVANGIATRPWQNVFAI